MSAETEAYAVLAAAGSVTALVSDRIYPDFVPQEKTLPAIAITRTGTEYLNTIHGTAPVASRATLELWCLAAGRAAAETLADSVELAVAVTEFVIIGRRPEYDPETEVWATVLTVDYWQ